MDSNTNTVTDTFSSVLRDEVSRLRPEANDPQHTPEDCADRAQLVGLAFSGGGIRSATFNLGVLQGLARNGLLPRIDYLSTVSGDGPKWSAWRWLGSPAPMLGVTPNFTGDTSVFYAGLNYEWSLSNRWTDELTWNLTKPLFVGASLSVALHNGPLHKNNWGCQERSDCGFGYRALPRLGFELGGYFSAQQGISIFYDHMSHKHFLPGENEGIDHIGIRYHYLFNRR